MFNKNFDHWGAGLYAEAVEGCSGALTWRGVRPAAAARKGHFVMVPLEWVHRLESATAATWRVALTCYTRVSKIAAIRSDCRTVPGIGWVTPGQKWRALAELEKLGLVSAEKRPRKSPNVTLLYPTEGG